MINLKQEFEGESDPALKINVGIVGEPQVYVVPGECVSLFPARNSQQDSEVTSRNCSLSVVRFHSSAAAVSDASNAFTVNDYFTLRVKHLKCDRSSIGAGCDIKIIVEPLNGECFMGYHDGAWQQTRKVESPVGASTRLKFNKKVIEVSPCHKEFNFEVESFECENFFNKIQLSSRFFDQFGLKDRVSHIEILEITHVPDVSFSSIVSFPKCVVIGLLNQELESGDRVVISHDDGVNWNLVTVEGKDWFFVDNHNEHKRGDRLYKVRVLDCSSGILASDSMLTKTHDGGYAIGGRGDIHFIDFDDGGDGVLSRHDISSVTLSGKLGSFDTLEKVVISNGSQFLVVAEGDIRVDAFNRITITGQNLRHFDDGAITVALYLEDGVGGLSYIQGESFKSVGGDNTIEIISVSDNIDSFNDSGAADPSLVVRGSVALDLLLGQRVEFSDNGGLTWNIAVSDGLNWCFDNQTNPHEDGERLYLARLLDANEQIIAETSQLVTIDKLTPEENIMGRWVRRIAFDDGGDGLLNANEVKAVTLSGHVEVGDRIVGIIVSDGIKKIQVDADVIIVDAEGLITVASQNFSMLVDGELTVTLYISDRVGSPRIVRNSAVKDTLIELHNQIKVDAISTDAGAIGDFGSSGMSLILSGSLAVALSNDELLKISNDDGISWHRATVDNIFWLFDDASTTLLEGKQEYLFKIVDTAGNVGTTASHVVTIDSLATGSATGTHQISIVDGDDNLLSGTELKAVTITGTIEPRDIFNSLVVQGSDPADTITLLLADVSFDASSGKITAADLDLSSFAAGVLTVTLRLSDRAGNTYFVADSSVINTALVSGLWVSIDAISLAAGDVANDFIISDRLLILSGSLSAPMSPDQSLEISNNKNLNWTTVSLITAASASWEYHIESNKHDHGEVIYKLRVVDAHGKVGASDEQAVFIDIQGPTSDAGPFEVKIVDGDDKQLNRNEISTVEIHATIDADDTFVSLVILGVNPGDIITLSPVDIEVNKLTGRLTIPRQDLSAFGKGVVTVIVNIKDVAGNTGSVKASSVIAPQLSIEPELLMSIDTIDEHIGRCDDDLNTKENTLTIGGHLSMLLKSN